MRDETRRRLDRMLFIQKAKWGIAALAVAVVVGAGLALEHLDTSVARTETHDGTVVHVGPLVGKYAAAVIQNNVQVDVRLPDARVAHLLAPKSRTPAVGEHVRVAEQIHGTGRHTFSWK